LPVTCGNWDLQKMLPVECGRKGLNYSQALRRWCNIKDLFWQATQQEGRGMAGMLQCLGLRLKGRHHSGIDDSRNIARIFQELLCRFGHAICCPADPFDVAEEILKRQHEKTFLKCCKVVRDICKLEEQKAGGEKLNANQEQKMNKKSAALKDVRDTLESLAGDSALRQKNEDVIQVARAELDVPKQAPAVVEPQVAVDDEEIDLPRLMAASAVGAATILQIVSGGQSGADRAGLDAAMSLGGENNADDGKFGKPRGKRGGRSHGIRKYEADHVGMS